MRKIVIIFLLSLLFIFGKEHTCFVNDRVSHYTDATNLCSAWNSIDKKSDFSNTSVSEFGLEILSGEGSNFTSTFHPTNSGKRTPQSCKSSLRAIYTTIVFGRINFHIFQGNILQFLSGIRSSGRYIYFICRLLI